MSLDKKDRSTIAKKWLEFIVKLLPYATPRKSQSVTEVKADIWEPPLFITE